MMTNQKLMAVVLVAAGLLAVNFFYLSDILLDPAQGTETILGWKSGIAIIIANLLAVGGIGILLKRGDDTSERRK